MRLAFAWNARRKLRAEGEKLQAKSNDLWDETRTFRAEGEKLWAEGEKLQAEGDRLWAEAILETYGNVTLEWRWNEAALGNDCVLANGEHYVADEALADE